MQLHDEMGPEHADALLQRVSAAMARLGNDGGLVDDADEVARIRIARINPTLVLVERFADRARSRMHGYAAYSTDHGGHDTPFKMDPRELLFVLVEQHYASPPDWRLQLVQNPSAWFTPLLAEIDAALAPTKLH